jgi:hypothetical protein
MSLMRRGPGAPFVVATSPAVSEITPSNVLWRLVLASGRVGSVSRSSAVARPAASRWTSFLADGAEERPRILSEEGNPVHRLRVEHNRDTLLVHLSGEDGSGWTVLAVDRATRRWAVAQARRQREAARDAFERLYPDA